MLSIGVCDDEIMECCMLSNRIKEILNEKKIPCVIHRFYSGEAILKEFEGFDILFLDIMMKGIDGMEAARLFRQKASDKILIFVSSSREYVWDAYDVEAFHYLVKPVDQGKLKSVLQRAIEKAGKHPREYIMIRRERQREKIFLDSVCYFEIRGRMIDVHGREGVCTYYEQLHILESMLLDKGFFRCHKSYLVNLKYVASYSRQEILLDNGEKIPIAKRRYDGFCQELLTSMKKNGGIF